MKNEEEEAFKKEKSKNADEMEGDDSSEWSLDSLEDIKGVSIHQLEEENDNTGHHHKEKPLI